MNNVKNILILINVLNAILKIFAYKILMKIVMDNAFVKMVIMMIIKIVYVNHALHFGKIQLLINLIINNCFKHCLLL